MTAKTRIFLAHASEDKGLVRDLYSKLVNRGFKPWLDEIDLLPGQNWQIEIPKAIRESDIFIACLSRLSVRKQGYVQREFRFALSTYAEKPPGSIYLIPLKLDDCEIPDFQLPQLGISLRDIQWLDYWRPDGFERLISAIEAATGHTSAQRTFGPSSGSTHPKVEVVGGSEGNAPFYVAATLIVALLVSIGLVLGENGFVTGCQAWPWVGAFCRLVHGHFLSMMRFQYVLYGVLFVVALRLLVSPNRKRIGPLTVLSHSVLGSLLGYAVARLLVYAGQGGNWTLLGLAGVGCSVAAWAVEFLRGVENGVRHD